MSMGARILLLSVLLQACFTWRLAPIRTSQPHISRPFSSRYVRVRASDRPPASVQQVVQQAASGESISLEAWVYTRRIHGRKLAFITLGNGERGENTLQAVLKDLPDRVIPFCVPGARIAVRGDLEDVPGRQKLLKITEARLLSVAPILKTVVKTLEAAHKGELSVSEAKSVLGLSAADALPSATDDEAAKSIYEALRDAAPAGAWDSSSGIKQPTAIDPWLADLLTEGGLDRVRASLEAAGGVSAAIAAISNDGLDGNLSRSAVVSLNVCNLTHGLVLVDGEVCSSRQMKEGIICVELRGASNTTNQKTAPRQRCVFHPSFGGHDVQSYARYARRGARFRFIGVRLVAQENKDGAGSGLLVCAARLLLSSVDARAVRALVDSVADGSMNVVEAMTALVVDSGSNASADNAETWKASLLLDRKFEREYRISSLHEKIVAHHAALKRAKDDLLGEAASLAAEDEHHERKARYAAREAALQSLDHLRTLYPLHKFEVREEELQLAVVGIGESQADVTMQQQQPARRVRARGAIRTGHDDSRWQIKKRPQVMVMSQIIADLLRSLPGWTEAGGGKCAQILDIGGSKGLLSQHLAERFGSCVNVTVVDLNRGAIKKGTERARRRGQLDNIRFLAGDAVDLARTGALGRVDVVIGLHACGGLSDVILGQAVAHGAAFAITSCCYMAHRHLKVQAAGSGVIARDEWLGAVASSPEGKSANETDAALTSEALLAALHTAEEQSDPAKRKLGEHTVNAIRAAAVEQRWAQRWQQQKPDEKHWKSEDAYKGHEEASVKVHPHEGAGCDGRGLQVQLLSFDPKYSQKNLVLVGTPTFEATAPQVNVDQH